MQTFDIGEVQENFHAMIGRAAAGESFFIAKGGVCQVKVLPLDAAELSEAAIAAAATARTRVATPEAPR